MGRSNSSSDQPTTPIAGPLTVPASSRQYITVYNDQASGGNLLVLLGTGVSATTYSLEVAAGDMFGTPQGYKGPVDILPQGGATGQVTEIK